MIGYINGQLNQRSSIATRQTLPTPHTKQSRSNTGPASDWPDKFVSAVANRRSSELFLQRFEEISLWMREKPDAVTANLDQRFLSRGLDLETARRRSLKLLDSRLSTRHDPWSRLGLSHDVSKQAIRERYQRLMQMYHPDKGLAEAEWLTERVTRIRKAYDEIEADGFIYKPKRAPRVANPDKRMSKEWQEIAAANRRRPGNLRSSPNRNRVSLATRLRRRLGDAERFKRRVMLTLVAAGVLYAVLLIHSVYSEMPKSSAATRTTIAE